MEQNIIKLNETKLKKIVAESIKKVLKEECSGDYDELIRNEMHNLVELEQKLPEYLQPQIHDMITTMEGILQEIQRNNDFDNWNN